MPGGKQCRETASPSDGARETGARLAEDVFGGTGTGVSAGHATGGGACQHGQVKANEVVWIDPEYTGGDNIHPSTAGGNVIAEAIWAIMQENCIAQ
jgi:lysophospholipase L1-like esterase